MHIAITVNAAWNIWNFRRSLVQALLEDGARVTIIAPADDSVPRLVAMGCQFLPIEFDSKNLNPARELPLILRFRTAFTKAKPDVILSFTVKNNIYGALAARSLGMPFIATVTGLGTAFLSNRLLRTVAENLYRIAFLGASTVFFQNEDDRDMFASRRIVPRSKARMIAGSGVDLRHFAQAAYPDAERPIAFLMVARLLRDKGVAEYVEAAQQVHARHPDVRFQLLGAEGVNNRTAISAAEIEQWDRSGCVEYLGATDDVRPLIAAADCLVLPSYREGAPRVLIEGAAIGRPAIATDVPGCRDVVKHGETGLLCDVRDADSLAAAMERFIALPHAARAAMGAAGRDRMEKVFSDQAVIAAYRAEIARLAQ